MVHATSEDNKAIEVALKSSLESLQELTERMGLDSESEDLPSVGELELDLVMRMADLTESLQKAQIESATKDAALIQAKKNTEALASEVAALDSRYQVLVAKLEGQRDRSLAKAALLEDELENLKREQKTALDEERAEMAERIADLEKSSKEASDLAAALQESVPQLKYELEKLKKDKGLSEARNEELGMLLKKKENETEVQAKAVEAMKSHLEGMKKGLLGVARSLGESKASFENLSEDKLFQHINVEIAGLLESVAALQTEKRAIEKTIASLEQHGESAESAIKTELKSLRKLLDEENAKRKEQETKFSKVEEERVALSSEVEVLRSASDTLKGKLESVEGQNVSLQSTITGLNKNISTKEQELREKEIQIADMEKKLKRSEGSITEQVRELQQALTDKEKLKEDIASKLRNKEEKVKEMLLTSKELEANVETLRSQLITAENGLSATKKEMQGIVLKLDQVEQSRSLLQSQLDEKVAALAKLEKHCKKLENDFAASESSKESLSLSIKEFTDKLAEKDAALARLESSRKSADENFAKIRATHTATETSLKEKLAHFEEEQARSMQTLSSTRAALEKEKEKVVSLNEEAKKEQSSLLSQIKALGDEKSKLAMGLDKAQQESSRLAVALQESKASFSKVSDDSFTKTKALEEKVESLVSELNKQKSIVLSQGQELARTKKSLEQLQATNKALESAARDAENKLSAGTEQIALTEKVASEQIVALEEKLHAAMAEAEKLRRSNVRKNEVLSMSKKFLGDILEGKESTVIPELDEVDHDQTTIDDQSNST